MSKYRDRLAKLKLVSRVAALGALCLVLWYTLLPRGEDPAAPQLAGDAALAQAAVPPTALRNAANPPEPNDSRRPVAVASVADAPLSWSAHGADGGDGGGDGNGEGGRCAAFEDARAHRMTERKADNLMEGSDPDDPDEPDELGRAWPRAPDHLDARGGLLGGSGASTAGRGARAERATSMQPGA